MLKLWVIQLLTIFNHGDPIRSYSNGAPTAWSHCQGPCSARGKHDVGVSFDLLETRDASSSLAWRWAWIPCSLEVAILSISFYAFYDPKIRCRFQAVVASSTVEPGKNISQWQWKVTRETWSSTSIWGNSIFWVSNILYYTSQWFKIHLTCII